ncbi:MAG TPA: molybdate ABC transporter substrate-binding protein [Solirubrobacteraceae bacterium]|jgi:molybdate transport system substrate-binding protein|nr:molybdate ABC transporter substrate-binding protein [Solirubrobacteraceae bacterium]
MSKNLVTRALMLALILGLAAPAAASALNVYAASSLRDAFTQIDASPTYNFLGSNTLQLQIERGAPADVFASASPTEAHALFRGGHCQRPVTFATNKLVMLVPKGNPKGLKSVYRLRPGGLRLAVGNAGVPVGGYTRTLLRRLGLSRVLTNNTVSNEANVAGITEKVASGSADAGFAYVTDAKIASSQVDAIRLPRYAQPPVRYKICRVVRSGVDAAGADSFIAKVRAKRGRGLLRAAGFGLPPSASKR